MKCETPAATAFGPRRRWLIGVIVVFILIGTWVVRDDLRGALRSLLHADAGWVIFAIPVLMCWYLAWSAVYLFSRRMVDVSQPRTDVFRLLPATAASIAINLVAKSAGLAGMASFLARAHRRGEPRGRVIAAYLLATVLTEVGFVVVLLVALASVAAGGNLTVTESVAAVVFAIYTAARLGLLVVAAQSQTLLRRLWSLPRRAVDRLLRRPPQPPNTETPDELYDAVALARRRPWSAMPSLLAAVGVDLCAVVMLWAAILAITGENRPAAAFVAYGVSSLFGIVGFLPGGIGFVEVGGVALLVGAGLTAPAATAVMLLYRMFDFWIPLAVGGLSSFWLGRRAREVAT